MYEGTALARIICKLCFRLPSALDNRPLKFPEFEEKVNQVIFVTATPGPYELERVIKL